MFRDYLETKNSVLVSICTSIASHNYSEKQRRSVTRTSTVSLIQLSNEQTQSRILIILGPVEKEFSTPSMGLILQ